MKFLILLLLVSFPAFAFQYEAPLEDAKQEQAAQELFHLVRCLVCDGESLASSAADYSVSMRALIREKISQGESKEQIVDYLLERYGEGILQAPPKQGGSLILWLSPFLALILGAFFMRRKRK